MNQKEIPRQVHWHGKICKQKYLHKMLAYKTPDIYIQKPKYLCRVMRNVYTKTQI